MALTKRTESSIVYLEAKYYCLWRPVKEKSNGCETVEVKNPRTGQTLTKHGYRYDTVSGRVLKLVKYDTNDRYPVRYFGFKLHLVDGTETYVLDMPYYSQILRRFLRVAKNIDWNEPLSITVFKGKKSSRGEAEETGIWFRQHGATVKPYYTREQPHGMPPAVFDDELQQWDFKEQHRWLVDRLKCETVNEIETAAQSIAPPVDPDAMEESVENIPMEDDVELPPHGEITDDDVPF